MEDDKKPATPRTPAAGQPNDASDSSTASGPTGGTPNRRSRPPRIPPATFVPPVAPSQGADTPTASPEPPRKRPTKAAGRPAATSADTPDSTDSNPPAKRSDPPGKKPAKTPGKQTAKKAAKKAAKAAPSAPPAEATPASSPAASATPPARDDTPAAPAQATGPGTKGAARKATAPEKAETAVPVPAARDTAHAEATAQVQAPTDAEAPAQIQAPAQVRDTEQVVPTPLWARIKAAPGYAPELLALAAVEHLGPPARENLTWLRETYPTATTAGLARIATSRSVRLARTQGAVAGLLGPEAVLAQTAALLWNQARMVLDIAAAYGRDPAHPERAAELLTLQGVHPDLAAAREALAAARAAGEAGGPTQTGDRAPQVTMPLVRVAGRALLRMLVARRAARLVPGAGAVLTVILDGRATEQLATRAVRWYGRSVQER